MTKTCRVYLILPEIILFMLNTPKLFWSHGWSFCTKWLQDSHSRIVYECRPDKPFLTRYQGSCSSTSTRSTVYYFMCKHADDFIDAAFESKDGAGDGNRWWYIITWALSRSCEQQKEESHLPQFVYLNRSKSF